MGGTTKESNTVHPEDNSKVLFSMPDIISDDGGKNVVKIPGKKTTAYEKLVYALDILIPTVKSEDEIIEIPDGSYVQKVIYGKLKKVRVLKEPSAGLPDVLVEKRETDTYRVIDDKDESWFPLIDLSSPFIRKWDNLTLLLLLFTASVTPFETAFIPQGNTVDLLFLINRIVDVCFGYDMTIQMRTPFRDADSGRMVFSKRLIINAYLKSWFFIDFVSVFPFELIGFGSTNTADLSKLMLLRFFRLARLLKLLRILRANKKLQRLRVNSKMRYTSIQFLGYFVTILFVTHWLASGYRLASDMNNPETDAPGWVERYAIHNNISDVNSINIGELYIVAMYWSTSQVTLIGSQYPPMQPATIREWGYCLFAQMIAYGIAVYQISTLADLNVHANKNKRKHELKVDKYLEMFDELGLNPAIKFKVNEYLNDQHALEDQTNYQKLLKNLPVQWNGLINMEIFLPFLADVPYLETFIDREPGLMIELCRCVEIQAVPPNSLLFFEGLQGIYRLDKGIVSIEGRVYISGDMLGETCMREFVKKNEARALTNVVTLFLPKTAISAALAKHPKIRYYVRRWTHWQLLQLYIMTYKRLYFLAAKRGATMQPPLYSGRGNMDDDTNDDIDLAVMDHMKKFGY